MKGTDEKGYYNTIPEGTKLLSVSTKDGVCYVDFNKEFTVESDIDFSLPLDEQIVIINDQIWFKPKIR